MVQIMHIGKAKMKICLQSIGYNLWLIVTKGPYVPMKKVDNVDKPKLIRRRV